MASSARIDELKQKFDENPRRYFAPLANEFRKVGDLEQAILICEAYLPQQPGHMSGHIVYGQALFESNRLDEALGVFQTALSLDPENLIALRHLGDIAARQGDATSARRWYERVLEADPRNEEIQGLIGGLAEERVPANEPAPVGFVEPPAAPPAAPPIAPVEAFAAAPDAHFATPDVVEAEIPELLDLDVTMPESAPAATEPAAAAPPAPSTPDFESTSVADFDRMPETRDLMPEPSSMAEGFESTEFTAPNANIAQEPGLQSAFEDETGVNGAAVTPLAGLEATPGVTSPEPAAHESNALPELDEPLPADEELVLPPHGDSMAASAPAPAPAAPTASSDDALLDFDMPVVEEAAAPAPTTAEIPPELPPEVIAAEAELIDATAAAEAVPSTANAVEPEPESVGGELSFIDTEAPSGISTAAASSEEQAPEPEPVAAAQRPFVTETMAELYLKQGFRTEALAVYEQLSAANPSDERLAERVASLRSEAAPAPAAGPPVREFFARFASRRPWERAAAAAPPSENDFAASEVEVAEVVTPATELAHTADAHDVPPAASAASAPEPTSGATGGSIDALFGNKPATSTEDSAASALSQAFGGTPEAPPITGNPARPATGELSLDSVFREGGSRGPRNSQGFSFDQFFSQNADGERTSGGPPSQEKPASGEPAERTADDIEQFNSWLQGLKQR
jgi:tetratricopeptide (TPR) repeat protein